MDRNVFYDKFRFAQVVPEACGCSSNDFSDTSFTSYIFNYVASGEGTYAINGRTYEVKAGDVFISPPYLPTSQRSTGERRWEKLWVACVLINPEASFVLNQLTAACRVASCEELGQLFRDITERADGTIKNAYYTCGKLYELLYALAERVQTIDENGSIYIEYAKEYINAHFSEHLMIADVAAMLSLDRSYFSRLFYAETQMTAKSYLRMFACATPRICSVCSGAACARSRSPAVIAISAAFPARSKRSTTFPPAASRPPASTICSRSGAAQGVSAPDAP